MEEAAAPTQSRRINPCWCCGMSLKRWCYIFSIFDIVTGTLVLLGTTAILVMGDFGVTKEYPFKGFTFPRELLFSVIFVAGYTVLTGTLLILSVSCKEPCGLYAWLILSFPFNFVNLLKIFFSVVVFKHAGELRKEEKSREYLYDQLDAGEKPQKAFTYTKKVVVESLE